jgi:cell division protein FtsB
LNRVGDTYWLSNRHVAKRVATQPLPAVPVGELAREWLPLAVSSLRLIPTWVFLAMILIATLGVCSTVITRSRAELKASSLEFGRMTSEIEYMRRANNSLRLEIRRMASDPGTIEAVARERLGMVRPNDIVVPIGLIRSTSGSDTLSFVR